MKIFRFFLLGCLAMTLAMKATDYVNGTPVATITLYVTVAVYVASFFVLVVSSCGFGSYSTYRYSSGGDSPFTAEECPPLPRLAPFALGLVLTPPIWIIILVLFEK